MTMPVSAPVAGGAFGKGEGGGDGGDGGGLGAFMCTHELAGRLRLTSLQYFQLRPSHPQSYRAVHPLVASHLTFASASEPDHSSFGDVAKAPLEV